MNWVEGFVEAIIGYPVDWAATGTWAQLGAAFVALKAASQISRRELDAQRAVARDADRQFVRLIEGICGRAVSDIEGAAEALKDGSMRDLVRGGDGPRIPNTTTNVLVLRELDLNRMPSPKMALAVAELRRLSGWGKTYQKQARDSWYENGALDNEFVDALDEWALSARDAFRDISTESSELR